MPQIRTTDEYFTSGVIWGFRWLFAELDPYKGKWVVSFLFPTASVLGECINFPAVVDDFGNLIRVPV